MFTGLVEEVGQIREARPLENGRALRIAATTVLDDLALGDSVADAQERAYAAISGISWHGEFHRHDIGWRAIKRERQRG